MDRPDVSVIILTYNEEKNIASCLDAVFAQNTDRRFEVIVVDSGSTDKTIDILQKYPVRLFRIPRRSFSHGRTRQFAGEQARGDYLVYLVADAVPANQKWLDNLVRPVCSDPRVAGAYSRQVPRKNAGPVESEKLKNRIAGSEKRIVKAVTNEKDYWMKTPRQRLSLCKFDDVSACRSRRAWERIPIPDTPWAEDLAWAKAAIRQGYKIVFEPSSLVEHSHAETLWHSFRRAYLDQIVVKQWFGLIYYSDMAEILRAMGYMLFAQHRAIIKNDKTGFLKKLYHVFYNPLRLAFEVAGATLAARQKRTEHTVFDMAASLDKACLYPPDARERIAVTRFQMGNCPKQVIFMNPDSAAVFKVRVPEQAGLVFAAGINPLARPMRKKPVRFVVAVEGQILFNEMICPAEEDKEPTWRKERLDLGPWSGRMVKISLLTRSEDTDYAWAGWGQPKITTPVLKPLDRAYNRLLELIYEKAAGKPLRHP